MQNGLTNMKVSIAAVTHSQTVEIYQYTTYRGTRRNIVCRISRWKKNRRSIGVNGNNVQPFLHPSDRSEKAGSRQRLPLSLLRHLLNHDISQIWPWGLVVDFRRGVRSHFRIRWYNADKCGREHVPR